MLSKRRMYKIRVLIAVTAIVALSGLLITFYNYRLAEIAIRREKESSLEYFTGKILTEIDHLEVTLETTIQIMNDEHIAIARAIDFILTGVPDSALTSEELQRLAGPLNILELNIVSPEGIITHSNVSSLIGFNYNDYDETRIYIALATGTLTEIREEPRQSVLGGDEYGYTNHYAGIPRTGGGFFQLGFDASIIRRLYDEFSTAQAIRDIDIEGGYGMVLTGSVITAHPDSAMLGTDVSGERWYRDVNTGYGYTWLEIDGGRYYARYINDANHTIVGLISEYDFQKESRDILYRSLIIVFFAVAIIIPVTYMLTTGFIYRFRKIMKAVEAAGGEDGGDAGDGDEDDSSEGEK